MGVLALKTQKRMPNSIEISVQGCQMLYILIHSISGVKIKSAGVKSPIPC